MERESILFYRSFYEVSKSLPEDEGNKFLRALLDYAFYGTEPELDGVSASFFILGKDRNLFIDFFIYNTIHH